MRLKRHPACDGIGNAELLRVVAAIFRNVLKTEIVALKVPITLIHRPPPIAFEHLIINRHDRRRALACFH